MFYVEEEIVTFTFCSPGVALNSKALSRSFVFGTEDRSLKAYFYIFISLQTFLLQAKKRKSCLKLQSSGWSDEKL